jgi:4,5-DOPA dioxygenase extradiol
MRRETPSVFISHGLPSMALMDDPYNTALVNFGRNIELKGIVAVSSHWVNPGPVQVTSNKTPFIQHNFHGYQKDLYNISYQPPYSAQLQEMVTSLLENSGFPFVENPHYGFDHGVWMPLRLIRPEADIPIVQLSLPLYEDLRLILKLGHVLSPLRDQGILLLGSGMAAFNPSKLIWYARDEVVNDKIKAFDDWLTESILQAKIENILDYRLSSPFGEFAHPSSANLLPLFFTMGSAVTGDRPQILFKGFRYSSTSLLSFCLGQKAIRDFPYS